MRKKNTKKVEPQMIVAETSTVNFRNSKGVETPKAIPKILDSEQDTTKIKEHDAKVKEDILVETPKTTLTSTTITQMKLVVELKGKQMDLAMLQDKVIQDIKSKGKASKQEIILYLQPETNKVYYTLDGQGSEKYCVDIL